MDVSRKLLRVHATSMECGIDPGSVRSPQRRCSDPCHHVDVIPILSNAEQRRRARWHGHVERAVEPDASEGSRHHANDGEGVRPERQLTAKHAPTASKEVRPRVLRQNDDGRVLLVVLTRDRTTKQRRHTEHREVTALDEICPRILAHLASFGENIVCLV